MSEANISATDSGEGGGGGVSNQAGAAAQAVAFVTEFNQTAAIFNGVFIQFMVEAFVVMSQNAALARSSNTVANTAYNNGLALKVDVDRLQYEVSQLRAATNTTGADNPHFDNCTRSGTPC